MGNVDSIMTARRCPLLVLIDTSCRKTPLLTSGGLASGAGGGVLPSIYNSYVPQRFLNPDPI